MKQFDDRLPEYSPQDRDEWRTWLEANHGAAEGVWLIIPKVNSGVSGIRLKEAVQEALCFGWIDSKMQSLDDTRYRLTFTPRKRGSIWSKQNKGLIEEAIGEGRMTDAGMIKIEAAKRDGYWHSLDAAEALIIPDDLENEFKENPAARRNFDKFSESQKKRLLFYIYDAKRVETRLRRISRVIGWAEEGVLPDG